MMSLTWYLVGLFAGGAAYIMFKIYRASPACLFALSGCAAGIGLILFSAAWSVASILEGVPRAASMGLLLFGLPGIVVLTFFAKRLKFQINNTVAGD